jgi:hypothetical protein
LGGLEHGILRGKARYGDLVSCSCIDGEELLREVKDRGSELPLSQYGERDTGSEVLLRRNLMEHLKECVSSESIEKRFELFA